MCVIFYYLHIVANVRISACNYEIICYCINIIKAKHLSMQLDGFTR